MEVSLYILIEFYSNGISLFYLVSVHVLVKYSVKQSTEDPTFPVATMPFTGWTEIE